MNEKLREACKQAVRDLLTQDAFGVETSSPASAGVANCTYLNEKGHSCVVGLLVKRAVPDLTLDRLHGTSFNVVHWHRTALEAALGSLTEADVDLLRDMQRVHDMAAGTPAVSVRESLMMALTRTVLAGDEAKKLYLEVLCESQGA